MALRPKNWKEFQHYKDRRPPWIRLYHKLMDDPDLWQMPAEDYRKLTFLWLIASEHENGDLPSIERLAFRLRMSIQEVNGLLSRLSPWLEQDASTVLAECKQDATPETETEAEAEQIQKQKAERPLAFSLPHWLDVGLWKDFEEMRKRIRAPMTDRAKRGILDELEDLRSKGHAPNAVLQQSINNSYRGVFPLKGAANGFDRKNQGSAQGNGDLPGVKTGSAYFDALLQPSGE